MVPKLPGTGLVSQLTNLWNWDLMTRVATGKPPLLPITLDMDSGMCPLARSPRIVSMA